LSQIRAKSCVLPDQREQNYEKIEEKLPMIDLTLHGRPRDLGGFTVRRTLPDMHRRLVGPFIFFDHMGPSELAPGKGIDVRPHPHICLATVTYLFAGELVHRDSIGSLQTIRPGDVNWMVAGSGIAHSERSSPESRQRQQELHGLQSWVALPRSAEELAPSFTHHPAATLPLIEREGATLRVILGTAYGQRSPVNVLSPTLYVEAQLNAGAILPLPDEHVERAAYVVTGEVSLEDRIFREADMAIFAPGPASLRAIQPSRVMLLGGARLDGERHIWWNFVASTKERIESAKEAWREGRFAKVRDEPDEFIPLPDER
jgi:redox-sensitive bicupin YhaK (pirin superfamily)